MLCTRLEEIVHVCLHGVDHPHLLFEPCAFIVEPLLFFQKLLLLRLQCLQARQFFISLHGKQCTPRRLKNHKLCRMIIGLVPLAIGDPSFRKGRGGTNFVGVGGIPTSIFQIKGRVSLIENRRVYIHRLCLLISQNRIPRRLLREMSLHFTTDTIRAFVEYRISKKSKNHWISHVKATVSVTSISTGSISGAAHLLIAMRG